MVEGQEGETHDSPGVCSVATRIPLGNEVTFVGGSLVRASSTVYEGGRGLQ